jgi:nudix-type nucleoside diphosphatase (YffH/AdpP family)
METKIKEEYEITNREIKFEGSNNFKIEEITLQKGDKEIKRQVFDRGNAIAALVYNTETKKFIFVEQYRVPAEGVLLEIVAGGIEENEKPQDAVKREIAEELGYKVDKITHIKDFYVSPGGNREITALFYVEVSEKISEGGGVDDEDIKIVEAVDLGLNGNVIFEMFDDGRIVPPYQMIDAKSIVAINWWVGNKMMKSLWETVSDFKMKSL